MYLFLLFLLRSTKVWKFFGASFILASWIFVYEANLRFKVCHAVYLLLVLLSLKVQDNKKERRKKKLFLSLWSIHLIRFLITNFFPFFSLKSFLPVPKIPFGIKAYKEICLKLGFWKRINKGTPKNHYSITLPVGTICRWGGEVPLTRFEEENNLLNENPTCYGLVERKIKWESKNKGCSGEPHSIS